MPIYLKQSTASQEIPLGYFVDSTDGNTEETGLTIANTDIKLWKTGATTLANKNSGGATHISNGLYYTVLDATDSNTLGPMVVFCHVSGALAVRVECVVLAANVYDSLIGGGDILDVSTTQFNGSAVTQSGGRPEVNTSHISGSAVSAASAQIGVNVVQVSGDATAADNLEAAYDGTGYRDADNEFNILNYGTAQAGAAGTITLAAGASSTDDFYNNTLVQITGGTGVGQARFISDYVGSTRVANVNENWITNPDNTSVYAVLAFGSIPGATAPSAADIWTYATRVLTAATNVTSTGAAVPITGGGLVNADMAAISGDTTAADNLETAFDDTAGPVPHLGIVDQGTAQSATATTIVLRSAASFANSELVGAVVEITGGSTGVGQTRQITGYVGATDTATVDTWTVTPTGTITYKIFAAPPSSATNPPPVNVTQISGSNVSTTTAQLGVNVVQLSGSATAADNAELDFDGTGYAGGTTKRQVDVRQFNGSAATASSGRPEVNLTHVSGNIVNTDNAQLGVNVVNAGGSAVVATAGLLAANVTQISGDATAADNAEAYFDGTGYAGTNNVIPTVTTLTGHTAQTGDAFARLGAPTGASVSADIATLLSSDRVYVKNVAASNFGIYMALTDGSPGTGLTVAGTISKDGGSFVSLTNSVTEIGSGFYKVDITQSEMNADEILLSFTATGARQLPVKIKTQA